MIDEALAAWAALTLRGIQTVGNRLAVTVTAKIYGIVDITLCGRSYPLGTDLL
jgi:hypothetical protein